MLRSIFVPLAIAIATTAASASAAEWGNLKGRIVFDGKAPAPKPIDPSKDQVCAPFKLFEENLVVGKDGGLANVVIYVRTKNVDVHPDYEAEATKDVVLDNKDCRFDPHVVGLWNKQKLVLKNSDATAHNSKADFFSNDPINPLIPAMGQIDQKLEKDEATPVKVTCNIHPWMTAYMVVRPDPYFAVTDENGNFEIKNLPAGKKLEFQVWHESAGYLKDVSFGKVEADKRGRIELTLKSGDNDLGEAKAPAKLFDKK